MKKHYRLVFFTIFSVVYFSCQDSKKNCPEVHVHGALKNAMKNNDLSAHVDLKDFKGKANLYGLGARENLKGEVTVINSKPYISFAENEEVIITNSWSEKANFFIYSYVEKWEEHTIPLTVKTSKDLENYLAQFVAICSKDEKDPFPFLIQGVASSITWHIVNWDINDTIHTHEKHQKSGAYSTWINEPVEIIGFYAPEHAGVIRHHSTKLHMHVRTEDNRIVGHLDDILLGQNMVLKLPFKHGK